MEIKVKGKFTKYFQQCEDLIRERKLFCALDTEQLTDIHLLNGNAGAIVTGFNVEKSTEEEYTEWIIYTLDNAIGALIDNLYKFKVPLKAELIVINDKVSHLWLNKDENNED